MPRNSLVSVVIATKNRPAFLEKAILSVLQQTHQELEIIVIDDGSSPPVELTLRDERIRLISHSQSRGVAFARNAGMRAASGDFICLLDDDDLYHPEKIERQLDYLDRHPEADAVFSKVQVVDVDGGCRDYLPEGYVHTRELNFRYFNVIHTNSSLFRRHILDRCWFDERLTKYTDTQFYLAMCLYYNLHYLPITVAIWHKDDRRDQLSRHDRTKNYRNFALICDIFREFINSHPELRWRYWGRLGYQAFKCHDPRGIRKCLSELIDSDRPQLALPN